MKVLLIEDEPKMAQSVKTWLEENQVEVDCAFDGLSGRLLAERNTYDIIVSDVVLPKMNGIELCRQLRASGIQTPILILSALDQSDDKVLGLNAGADDYLSKPFDLSELLARIQALARRMALQAAAPNKLLFEDLELNLSTLDVFRAGTKIVLTPREFALLEYLVRNKGRVVPRSEILEHVWGLDFDIGTNVIEVYINYLRNKVDKGFGKKLIYTHFGVGYILKS